MNTFIQKIDANEHIDCVGNVTINNGIGNNAKIVITDGCLKDFNV